MRALTFLNVLDGKQRRQWHPFPERSDPACGDCAGYSLGNRQAYNKIETVSQTPALPFQAEAISPERVPDLSMPFKWRREAFCVHTVCVSPMWLCSSTKTKDSVLCPKWALLCSQLPCSLPQLLSCYRALPPCPSLESHFWLLLSLHLSFFLVFLKHPWGTNTIVKIQNLKAF